MEMAFEPPEQDQALLRVGADGRAGVGQRLADDRGRQWIGVVGQFFMAEQHGDAAIQGIEFFVAGFA